MKCGTRSKRDSRVSPAARSPTVPTFCRQRLESVDLAHGTRSLDVAEHARGSDSQSGPLASDCVCRCNRIALLPWEIGARLTHPERPANLNPCQLVWHRIAPAGHEVARAFALPHC